MKIVHCFYSLTVGGAEILAIDLLNEHCKEHECSLVIVNNKYSQELLTQLDKRVRVHFFHRKEGSRNPLPLLKFNMFLTHYQPDIIHCHEPKMGSIIKLGGASLLYTIHDTGISTATYHSYDRLAAISEAVFKDVAKRYQGDIVLVHNGINAHHFKRRKEYEIKMGMVRIVQVSRMIHEKKGQDILLQALGILKKKNGHHFLLDFIGIGPSTPYLQSLADNLGLSEQVHFLGEKDRNWVYTHLSDYDLLVQPSRFEGFGLTILEGFAAGLPVLASDIEGPAEIISKTRRGWLFQKEDVIDCATKIEEILVNYQSGSMRAIMENNIPVTDTEYSIQACAKNYLQQYDDLITKKANT